MLIYKDRQIFNLAFKKRKIKNKIQRFDSVQT